MDFSEMSDARLRDLARALRIKFDWDEWASPRYQLIQTIRGSENARVRYERALASLSPHPTPLQEKELREAEADYKAFLKET